MAPATSTSMAPTAALLPPRSTVLASRSPASPYLPPRTLSSSSVLLRTGATHYTHTHTPMFTFDDSSASGMPLRISLRFFYTEGEPLLLSGCGQFLSELSINSVPLLPKIMELVGLGYT